MPTLSEAINNIVSKRKAKIKEFDGKKQKFEEIKSAAADIMQAKAAIELMVMLRRIELAF